ncbi:MAG TPA: BadF/BadG/BcrA/BcrD ATPase family protein [Terriglobales bacterium]|nr:BadF/BadG/BcrA/BcrD ATPase family protein [Terriglobales bacterium]
MGFYLGIDGGGTKTRCALGNESEVLATAVAGGCNIVRLGEAQARESLHAVVRQVCSTAKISADEIDAICIGAAGAARPEIAAKLRGILKEIDPRLGTRVQVASDAAIALEAAFGENPGVIAIAGTGSIVYGRDQSGQTMRAGGWGFAVSDEGSGHWIGRNAISSLLHARDEGRHTELTSLILEAWKLDGIDELIQRANATPPPEFPRLFPVVVRAAGEGDIVALELLARAGAELAALVGIVLRRISPAPPYVPVATTGSVFRQSREVREVFYNRLQENFQGFTLLDDLVDPVLGALALARTGRGNHDGSYSASGS